MVGDPSLGCMEAMAGSLGYGLHWADWHIKNTKGIKDYASGHRHTAIITNNHLPLATKSKPANLLLKNAKDLQKIAVQTFQKE